MSNKIKGYRVMIGKKQTDFAKLLCISEGTYRLKEKGKLEFKQSEIQKIMRELKKNKISVTVEEIFFK